MTFLNRLKFSALAVILLGLIITSCEKDLTTIGAGVIGGSPFNTDKAVFDVFTYNKKIEAVRTNKLPVYQLGTFNHPLYGKTQATVTSQVLLPGNNPTFGNYTQTQEETANSLVPAQIPENEKIDSVYLYIPFLINPSGDADADGLADEFDIDPEDPNSDTDGDGLTDNQEKTLGTDPLNSDTDADDDGTPDSEDSDFVQNQFSRKVDLDSIYINGKLYDKSSAAMYNLRVERSNFFLRDLDPTTNFQQAQEYFSNQEFAPTFVDSLLYDSAADLPLAISTEQIPLRKRDDIATEEVNEADQFNYLSPGIRVKLDPDFFQHNILDKEGSAELLNQANFNDFLRGIHFSLTSVSDDIMFLFDLKAANITVSYSYDSADATGAVTEGGSQRDLVLNFIRQPITQQGQPSGAILGNAVNTYINDNLPTDIEDNLDTGTNASKIYLKGGAGTYAEVRLFDEEKSTEIINQIKANNWIINEANLVFYVADNSDVSEPPRLYLYNVDTGGPVFSLPTTQNDQTVKFFDYDGNLVKSADGKGLKYTVKITEHINNLIVRNAENATLGLTITPSLFQTGVSNAMLGDGNEEDLPIASTITPLGTVLYGSEVSTENADKKLQLEIFYTEAD